MAWSEQRPSCAQTALAVVLGLIGVAGLAFAGWGFAKAVGALFR